ncbi:hypothetical protein [Burkholderia cenocepacia]|uniref:hypothetical protein n=1 Tax=Burkholderia cenocepacia TaxID=95486 RepID=UPI0012AEB3F9|nr:hypothetical protein [Burkholderia cenocepacia]
MAGEQPLEVLAHVRRDPPAGHGMHASLMAFQDAAVSIRVSQAGGGIQTQEERDDLYAMPE